MRNTFLTISSLYFEIKYCTPESPAKPILLIFVSSLRAVEKKILTVNDYTRLINLTSYYSSFLEGDWDYLKLKLSHFLWNCLDMDQLVSSMSHFSSKVHKSVFVAGLSPLLFHSLSKYLLRTVSVLGAADRRRVNKTQSQSQCQAASIVVKRHSRFWLNWDLSSTVHGCRTRASWIAELGVIVIAYKKHIFCLMEDFDEMASNHAIKENFNII